MQQDDVCQIYCIVQIDISRQYSIRIGITAVQRIFFQIRQFGPRQLLPEKESGKLLSAQELGGTLRRWENGGCSECVKTSRFDGTNYPGTICMADEKTVIVCNRGANTLSAFSTDGKLRYLGEWATGNWPRHLLQIPGTDLIVNACNKEGTLVIFAWNGKELIRKDEIILPGASCAVYLSGK